MGRRYTQRQAIEATRNHYKATYIRVAEMLGLTTDDRDKAKKYVEKYAKSIFLSHKRIR